MKTATIHLYNDCAILHIEHKSCNSSPYCHDSLTNLQSYARLIQGDRIADYIAGLVKSEYNIKIKNHDTNYRDQAPEWKGNKPQLLTY